MNPQIGDIVYSSWGYDQTNVDFYEVVGKQGKITYSKSVLLELKVVRTK